MPRFQGVFANIDEFSKRKEDIKNFLWVVLRERGHATRDYHKGDIPLEKKNANEEGTNFIPELKEVIIKLNAEINNVFWAIKRRYILLFPGDFGELDGTDKAGLKRLKRLLKNRQKCELAEINDQFATIAEGNKGPLTQDQLNSKEDRAYGAILRNQLTHDAKFTTEEDAKQTIKIKSGRSTNGGDTTRSTFSRKIPVLTSEHPCFFLSWCYLTVGIDGNLVSASNDGILDAWTGTGERTFSTHGQQIILFADSVGIHRYISYERMFQAGP